MIQQFTELGRFFLDRDGGDELSRYAEDPAFKARGKTVLVLVFSEAGFQEIRVEEYDDAHLLWYLYRRGAANGCDATSTTGMPSWKPDKEGDFERQVRKRLKRLCQSAEEALANGGKLAQWEVQALEAFKVAAPEQILPALAEKY